jgi:diguanylate cyclase (GGDEF)-like protein
MASLPDDPDEKTSVQLINTSEAQRNTQKQSAYLVVIGGRSGVGKMFKLSGEMLIGRGEGAEILIDDEGVSRKHARIALQPDGKVVLTDLGSTNGTFYNGERIATQVLQDGGKIQVGSTAILKFSYQDALDEALQKNLYESATRDGLTRLHNKKYFTDTLDKEFSHARRHRVPLSVVMIDVDHFKKVNDTYGHLAGDAVLQRVAARLTELVRFEDTVARYGGEEFAIVLRESPKAQAFQCAERIRRALDAAPVQAGAVQIRVTLSAGVATLDEHSNFDTADALIAEADRMLYQAKGSGRNRVEPPP